MKHRAGERRCPASAVPPILQIPSGISDFRGDLTCIDKHAALKAKSLSIRRIPVRSPAQQIRFESREQQNEHTMGFAIKNSLQAIYRLQRVGRSVIIGLGKIQSYQWLARGKWFLSENSTTMQVLPIVLRQHFLLSRYTGENTPKCYGVSN